MATVTDLESRNAELRQAVEARLAATPADDPKVKGYTPMAASLAGCKPAQEAAARCFDTCADASPTAIADSDTPVVPEDFIRQAHLELKRQRAVEGWKRTVELGKEARMEQTRLRGDSLLADRTDESPAERMLLAAAAAVRDRRSKYGPPGKHFAITVALINAAFGTSFVPQDWATIMQLDKIARSRGPSDHPDNDIDCAGYAACRAECRAP